MQDNIKITGYDHTRKGRWTENIVISYCIMGLKQSCFTKKFPIPVMIRWLKNNYPDIYTTCRVPVDGQMMFDYEAFEIEFLFYDLLEQFITDYINSKKK